jgi:two-component system response regulator RegA
MSETPQAPTLLIADDDQVLCRQLVRALQDRGFDARGATSFDHALALARDEPPEYAVVDLRLGERNGLELVAELIALDPATEIVVLTGYGSIATAIDAVRMGAVYLLSKPADADDILGAFARGRSPPEVRPVRDLRAPSLARAEWEHVQRVLADCEGNVSEAARRLGIHRRSLQRKLAKYPPRH